MNADGSNARKLADADAGHGYAANWSLEGGRLAFVVRENPDEVRANQSAEALISNIYIVDVTSNEISHVTQFTDGRAETPHWSPDGNKLVFQYVLNGRMNLQVADLSSGGVEAVLTEPACCPSWMRK
jgi:Tol biopolymer transport system component